MIYKVDSINRTVYAGEDKGLTAVISTPVLGSRRDEPQTMRFINGTGYISGAGYINGNATDDINEMVLIMPSWGEHRVQGLMVIITSVLTHV